MAVLNSSNQWSANTAKTRLKQVTRDHAPHRPQLNSATPEQLPTIETLVALPAPDTTIPAAEKIGLGSKQHAHADRLSEIEQRQLLLQTVAIYKGWHLVSVQHRPESDVLVAHVVRNNDPDDPVVAIREGRSMQVIMDAMGDLKVQHPRTGRKGFWARMARFVKALFGFANDSRVFSPYGML